MHQDAILSLVVIMNAIKYRLATLKWRSGHIGELCRSALMAIDAFDAWLFQWLRQWETQGLSRFPKTAA